MTSIADGSVKIQTTAESNPSPPSWFGEVVLLAVHLCQHDVLTKIAERVRFARRRFGRYEVIDFLAILFGYAISGERTLETFYERLQPFAVPFMAGAGAGSAPLSFSALALFSGTHPGADRSAAHTLSRRFAESPTHARQANGKPGGSNRQGLGGHRSRRHAGGGQTTGLASDRRAAPALIYGWMTCAPLATPGASVGKWCGRAPSSARLIPTSGSAVLGTKATGETLEELRKALSAITRYLAAHQLPKERTLLHIFGQYGTGAILSDLAGFAFVTRGKEYSVLDHPSVSARLHLPPDQFHQRLESQLTRSLYDCPAVPIGSAGVACRVVVATHPAGKKKSPVGLTRSGVVYELFFTNLPEPRFTACDVVELYLHRGAFEPALADEDQEIDPDRWCSHSAWGQEAWGIVSQWVWNLRLEMGHAIEPTPVRTTEFAAAIPQQQEQVAARPPSSPPAAGYGPPNRATSWKAGRFSRMAHFSVPQGSRFGSRSGVGKRTAVYAWSMRPVFATAVPALCANSVNGMAAPPQSRAR